MVVEVCALLSASLQLVYVMTHVSLAWWIALNATKSMSFRCPLLREKPVRGTNQNI